MKNNPYIGTQLTLIELPNLRYSNPNVEIGKKYEIIDVEGSNFIFIDDDGDLCSIGSCRFDLNSKKKLINI